MARATRRRPRRSRRALGLSVLGVTAGVVAGLLALGSTVGGTPHVAGRPGPYYLAVGASESVGVQPMTSDHRNVRTDQGYADDLTAMEEGRWPGLQLVDLGCPGITAQAALDGGGQCRYANGSQIDTAVQFLEHHPHQVAFVTVDLGFNDLWPCLLRGAVDQQCVDAALHRVAVALPAVLAALRHAGGPGLLIVGLQHADPYVADAHFGELEFARSSITVFDRLNDILSSDYAAVDAAVARVPEPGADGPQAVELTCARTWMCKDHNIHPTPDGYRVIAQAIASAIAREPRRAG